MFGNYANAYYLYSIIINTKIYNDMKTQIENRIAEIRNMINYSNLSESELTTLLIERDKLNETLMSMKDKTEVDFVESMRNSMLY